MDKNLQQRVHVIAKQLNCPVCGGQSLDASDVFEARVLREEIARRVQDGLSDPDVIQSMANTYGTHILRQPDHQPGANFLWAGVGIGLLLLIAGGIFYIFQQRRRP